MQSSVRYFFQRSNGNIVTAPILGRGGIGTTIKDGNTALKLPLKCGPLGPGGISVDQDDAKVEESYEAMLREKAVYQRIGHHDAIVSCLDLSGDGIRMEFMENGNLEDFLAQHERKPNRRCQLAWFRAMTRALVHVHDHYVLGADIAARNFLLSADCNVKMSDFNQSILLPVDTDMETVDELGYSVATDIGQLGTVFYIVATGQPCEFDLFKNLPLEPTAAAWPQREDLPRTENIWIGSIIERCWTKGSFRNTKELLDALNSVTL